MAEDSKGKDTKAQADAKAQAATQAEVAEALRKGKNVRVQLPNHITSVVHEGTEYTAEDDGLFHMFARHALHVCEAFDGVIVSEVRKLEGKK